MGHARGRGFLQKCWGVATAAVESMPLTSNRAPSCCAHVRGDSKVAQGSEERVHMRRCTPEAHVHVHVLLRSWQERTASGCGWAIGPLASFSALELVLDSWRPKRLRFCSSQHLLGNGECCNPCSGERLELTQEWNFSWFQCVCRLQK